MNNSTSTLKLTLALFLCFFVLGTAPVNLQAAPPEDADKSVNVLVYGATPGGIAAAVSAARSGQDVLLVDPTRRIGGMFTNGLAYPGLISLESINGFYREFTQRVEQYYSKKYGPHAPQTTQSFNGLHAEPHVNLAVFENMLSEQDPLDTIKRHRLSSVQRGRNEARISTATFVGPDDQTSTFHADVFIDGSYEGDLLAKAGAEYRVGREARSKYNEPLAPKQADDRVQGYNFRLTVTNDPDLRVRPKKPEGYDREYFLPIVQFIKAGIIEKPFVRWSKGLFVKKTPRLPNGKYDTNDLTGGPVRQTLPEISDDWPEGNHATRKQILKKHIRHQVGMLYFVQNDPAVPEDFRKKARQWGFCKDEYTQNDHIPVQIYVREGRRLVGQYVFTQNDTEYASEQGARTVLHKDSIAIGDYILSSHGPGHLGPRFGGYHTGQFGKKNSAVPDSVRGDCAERH